MVSVTLCGRSLGGSPTDVIKAHRYTRHALREPLQLEETHAILLLLQGRNDLPERLDIGDLVTHLRESTGSDLVRDIGAYLGTVDRPRRKPPADVVIYGFGRIGRLTARILLDRASGHPAARLRAVIVRRGSADDLVRRASQLRRDSVHGRFEGTITVDKARDSLTVNGNVIRFLYADRPGELDLGAAGFQDVVLIDATGRWRDRAGLAKHLQSKGVARVLLTAPGKGDIPNVVYGVNHQGVRADDSLVAAASCTTNAVVPVLAVLDERVGVAHCHIETVHSFTNDQNLTDNHHAGSRRGRSAVMNLVIAETGAARAVATVLPELSGRLTGNAIRVPTPNVSIAILNLTLRSPATASELNAYLRGIATQPGLRDQIDYTESPEVVSTDINGTPRTATVDGLATIGRGHHAVVYVWYDNEYGYAHQVVRLLDHVSRLEAVRPPSSAATAARSDATHRNDEETVWDLL